MAKINILDSSIYNRIAAGEVVERPASAVKEFIENSLDAGAKHITVRIERGGKDLIYVADDGAGIEKSELPSAFLPHATSKIAKAEDLDAISTLGFRGEALASVGSVANVTLRSRFFESDEAYGICCQGGKIGEIVPCALESGTEIAAENLFFNTPVRAKFLKTDKGEESEVSACVARFILGNPSVAFQYFIDGKAALRSFGGGAEEAVAAVYGAAAVSECYLIDAVRHGIRVHGYIGKPHYTKPNRTYQSTFVNGRYVVNNTISSAIMNAYQSYLMKRQYPFYVLFIEIPAEAVDVNVHPNKSDVRFENNQVVYGSIYSIVSAVLDGNAAALDYIVKDEQAAAQSQAPADMPVINAAAPSDKQGAPAAESAGEKKQGGTGQRFDPYEKYPAPPKGAREGFTIRFADSGAVQGTSFADSVFAGDREKNEKKEAKTGEDVFSENKKYLEMLDKKAKQEKLILENAVYRGTLFNTYLIYEEGDSAYIIDQHAAHERLIFDKLCRETDERRVVRQPMLLPYVLQTNREEFAFLSENLQTVEAIGFDIEEFGGGSFKISAVPADLRDIDLKGFFAELLSEIGSLKGIRLKEILRDKIAMAACKHAVKGGMLLSDSEKEKLFSTLHGDMGLKCPHGRPVAVKMTKYEIEKLFKRIV